MAENLIFNRSEAKKKQAASARNGAARRRAAVLGDGGRLRKVITQKMVEYGHNRGDAAQAMGFSGAYFSSLMNNHPRARFAQAKPAALRSIAAYVDLPAAQVFLLADTLEPNDFFVKENLSDEIDDAFHAISEDPAWSGFAPGVDELSALPAQSKLFMCLLYERVNGTKLLTKATVDAPAEVSDAIE